MKEVWESTFLREAIMLDHAVVTFTFDEYITMKRIVLDEDLQGAFDFMKIIAKRLEPAITQQGGLKKTIDA